MASMKPHRRQWIISTQRHHENLGDIPGFQTTQIGDGLFLHHDSELLIEQRGGKTILGRMLREGDGRYVVIDGGRLHLDATGSMGVFYFSGGAVRCGSSPVLLSRAVGSRLLRSYHVNKLNWIPSPGAPIEGARRLMIDQVLDLESAGVSVEPRALSGPVTVDEAAALLAAESAEIVKALAATGRPIYLALTAGQDSRTAFAALVKSGIPFKAFTFQLSDGASLRDVRCARTLCRLYGIEHRVVKSGWMGGASRKRMYSEHSGEVDGDRGRNYAAGDYYRHIPDGALVVHGGTLGLSKKAFSEIFEDLPTLSRDGAMQAVRGFFGSVDAGQIALLEEWYDHRERYPISDIGDHFFLDQRRACWGSDNRFAEDVFGFEWILFANSWRMVDVFLSAPYDARMELLVQKKAIDVMLPGLNGRVPRVNPPMSFLERMRGRLSRRGVEKGVRRLRKLVG